MKTLIRNTRLLALIVVLLSGMQAFAQDKAPQKQRMAERREKREQRFEEASKKLGLTADQQKSIKAVIENTKTEMKELREANKDKPKKEVRTLMMGRLKAMDSQISALLDSKQQAIYEQMKAEKKKQAAEKRAEHQKMQEEMDDAGGGIF
jgi:C4-dicarboxylate-specific signal transduction histidine kinase